MQQRKETDKMKAATENKNRGGGHGLAARCYALPWSAFLKLSASSEAVGGGLGTATVDMAADPCIERQWR